MKAVNCSPLGGNAVNGCPMPHGTLNLRREIAICIIHDTVSSISRIECPVPWIIATVF